MDSTDTFLSSEIDFRDFRVHAEGLVETAKIANFDKPRAVIATLSAAARASMPRLSELHEA